MERQEKAGRIRRVTAPNGVGHPSTINDGGEMPEVAGLSPFGERGAKGIPMYFPFPPSSSLRCLCHTPFGGVQSSRASRATRILLSDILNVIEENGITVGDFRV